MPLIDAFRPDIDDGEAGFGRPDRIIADLGVALRVAKHAAAEIARAHLRAEADAEKRLALLQRHADPIDLAADEIVLVVGAHRAAENDAGGCSAIVSRQRVAEPRPPHVEPVAEFTQGVADASGRGMFLVQNDQDRQLHELTNSSASVGFLMSRRPQIQSPRARRML